MQLRNKLTFLSLIFFTIAIFLSTRIISLSIILIIVSFIIEHKNNISIKSKNAIIFYGSILFFVFHFLGLLYTSNYNTGFFNIEIKLSLLIFPVFFFLFNMKNIKREYILFSFVGSSSIFSVFLILRTLLKHFDDDKYYMFYTNFSYFFHPSYIAMYFSFAILILFYLVINRRINIYLAIGSTLPLLTGIYFAESKTGYIVFVVLLMLLTAHLFRFVKSYIFKTIIILILIVSVFFTIKDYRMRAMFYIVDHYKEVLAKPDSGSSTDSRILVYNSSLQIIGDNFWFGVGTGDVKDNLMQKYKELQYIAPIKKKLNAHNQFLETFIGLGIFGFLTLVFLLTYPLIIGIKNKDILTIGFLVIIIINFLFESMLDRQAGVVFFAFFYSFLVMRNSNKFETLEKKE